MSELPATTSSPDALMSPRDHRPTRVATVVVGVVLAAVVPWVVAVILALWGSSKHPPFDVDREGDAAVARYVGVEWTLRWVDPAEASSSARPVEAISEIRAGWPWYTMRAAVPHEVYERAAKTIEIRPRFMHSDTLADAAWRLRPNAMGYNLQVGALWAVLGAMVVWRRARQRTTRAGEVSRGATA